MSAAGCASGFGQAIWTARLAAGLTQAALARE